MTMLLKYKFLINFTILTFSLIVSGELNDTGIKKLVLSPAELATMVLKHEMEKIAPRGWRQHTMKSNYPADSELTTCESAIPLAELSDDETLLKRRKVWSRWGKWGECSVTCGGGKMTRKRVCLAGRCAPGEHEEQCRPCARSPCSHDELPISGDTHDLE